MRALLLGANSKPQPAIQISTELKWLIAIEPSLQGGAVALLMDGAPAAISLRQNRATFTKFIVLTDSPAHTKAAHKNRRSSKLRATLDEPT
jgi:hypothetical protein